MSAVLQVPVGKDEVGSAAERETPVVAPVSGPDNALELLRVAINRLNSSNGELQDQTQMANLLGEVQEALERANVIGRAFTQCEEFVAQARFDEALQSLDAGLLAYPNDAALLKRRAEVEQRQTAFARATTVRTVLEEAEWLVQQDRPDLAAHLLKEKTAILPDQAALISRLADIESLLPQWEQDRQVHAALERAAALEERQQWQVALAIVEDTLQSYSASGELKEAACRVRDRLEHDERQSRLERRLRLIEQKIASRSWKQALALMETARKEFPGASELKPLQRAVDDGLRRAECEAIVSEVRQCLTDGELESAEQILKKGLESLGQDPAFNEVRKQLQAEKKYRAEFRKAQSLFSRRQLPEAERILTDLAAQDRTEAQALLDAVRQARAATEEETFCERGREKALKLMEQGQFAQAADLLDNLRGLFPGNPILERDLIAARAAIGPATAGAAQDVEKQDVEKNENGKPQIPRIDAPSLLAQGTARTGRPSGVRWAMIAGTASLAVASAAGVAWNFSHSAATSPVARTTSEMSQIPAVTPPGQQTVSPESASGIGQSSSSDSPQTPSPDVAQSASPNVLQKAPPTPPAKPSAKPSPAELRAAREAENAPAETLRARTLRPFVPPPTSQKGQGQPQTPAVPQESEATVSTQLIASTPVGLANPIGVTASLPAAQIPVQTRAAAPAPPAPVASVFQEPQLIQRTLPTYPAQARSRGLSGVVQLEAAIDDRGNVKNVKVLSGDGILSTAATQAVATWRYKPATLNGKPVASSTTIQVMFTNPASGGDSKK